MKFLLEKDISFSSSHWNISSISRCFDGKHHQLKFVLISGFMIRVEGVSDRLKVERGSSSATYVTMGNYHQNPDKFFSSRVRTLNIS